MNLKSSNKHLKQQMDTLNQQEPLFEMTNGSATNNWFRLLALVVLSLSIILGGCASLPEDVQRMPSFVKENTAGTLLGREIEPMVASHPGLSGFHLLRDGIMAFAARLALVKAAQKTIDAQYYIWHDDMTGKVLHYNLLDAADRGVRVRLLLDDLDTAGKDEMLHLIDAHPNIEIRLFNPFANRNKRAGDFLTDTRRVNHRMHNKSLTVDNQGTVFGGRNIGDEYFNAAEEVAFSDLDVLAIGPVVTEVSQSFDLYWNSQWVYPLASFKPEKAVTESRVKAFRQELDAYVEEARASDYAHAAVQTLKSDQITNLSGLDYTWGKWVLVYDQPSKVVADKVDADTHLAPKLKAGMDKTQHDLLIVSPYFVPGKDFTKYLVGLVEKGVRVRIMTNSLAANDVSLVHAGYMRYRKDLIKGGVELYEFKPNKKALPEKQHRVGSSHASLHGKFFGFDRRYLFIGSFNLDGRSVTLNTELGVYFESPEYAQLLSDNFDQQAINKGYHVVLTDEGDLEWVTLEDGREVRFDKEPETDFWKRFSTRFVSIFVPEGQL